MYKKEMILAYLCIKYLSLTLQVKLFVSFRSPEVRWNFWEISGLIKNLSDIYFIYFFIFGR